MSEAIEESSRGFIYDTEGELVAATDRLLADLSYRRKLGLRAHRAYQRHWIAEAHLQRYCALTREIAAKRDGIAAKKSLS